MDGGTASSATITATLDAMTLDVGLTGVTGSESLFMSEYVEGSSSNKAIELMNPLSMPFDLAANACALHFYINGNSTSTQVNLTGTIAAGDVFVVCNGLATTAVLVVCDQQSDSVNHTGDDAVELRCNGTTLDVIGQIGVDPGSEWGTGSITTLNHTLRRRCGVRGDPNGADVFDPATSGWAGFAQDTFDGLSDPSCAP
jgi:predicted extracellular nuclease